MCRQLKGGGMEIFMKLRADGYYVNRHSCYLLQYHLVHVTKYRKPVITGNLEKALKGYTLQYFKDRDIPVHAMETMPDHIHILFDAPPQMNLAEFINAFSVITPDEETA